MIKRTITYLIAAIIGIGIGGYSALAMGGLLPGDRRTDGPIALGQWRGDFAMGSADASPYFRARIARHGLLALANSEAVYFTRLTDEGGRPFSQNCTYRMSGGAMPARWWSVTLYNSENFLPDNDDSALSFDASRAGDGEWSATIAPQKPADGGGWISNRNAGKFDLTFRLYVPDQGVLEKPVEMIDAPEVKRINCLGEGS